MDEQKSKSSKQSQHRQSNPLNSVQQHLRQTEAELDAQIKAHRQPEDYEHFVRTPEPVNAPPTSDVTQMSPQTINSAQPLLQSGNRQHVEHEQMEGMSQPQPTPQRSSFGQYQPTVQSIGAFGQDVPQNQQFLAFHPPLHHPQPYHPQPYHPQTYRPQPYQIPSLQQHQPGRYLQLGGPQGGETWVHHRPIQAPQTPSLPRPLPTEGQAKLSRSYVGVNLDSKSETEVPEFHFPIEGFPNPPVVKSQPAGEGGSSVAGTLEPPFPGPITLLHVPDAVRFCTYVKHFLRGMFGNEMFGAEGIVRLETLDLWKLEGQREGYVVLADDACQISFPEQKKTKVWKPTYSTSDCEERQEGVNTYGKKWLPASVFAVLVPKTGTGVGKGMKKAASSIAWENDVRFFWSIFPIWPVLKQAGTKGLTVVKDFAPGCPKHKQLSAWLRESFLKAVIPPHSPDFKNAMTGTDYCSSMIDPDNALHRLHQNQFLFFASKDPEGYGSDLRDDRYLLHLHPAEREAASLAELTCASYLLLKREFFSAFYTEIYRSDKEIDPTASDTRSGRGVTTQAQRPGRGIARRKDDSPEREDTPMSVTGTPAAATPVPPASASSRPTGTAARILRVRTETAHQKWLENNYDVRSRRAKCLVTCWKEFGFLDEGRYLDWVRAGGMLEDAEVEDPDGGDGEE